jgi:hypothetical protein
MRLELNNGILYADNLHFSFAEVRHGATVPTGRHTVTTIYSHVHGEDLPNVADVGWVGHHEDAAVFLGRVRNRELIPCSITTGRLLGLLERAEQIGETVTFEVTK